MRKSSRRNSVAVSEISPELNLDSRDQLADEERFDNVVVRAQLETDDPVGFARPRGEENDGDVSQFGVAADRFADIEAVGIRQHDIQKDQVRPLAPAEVESSLPSLGAH